jgi:hypothetical protein
VAAARRLWGLLAIVVAGLVQYQRHAAKVAADRAQDEEEERWTAAGAEAESALPPRSGENSTSEAQERRTRAALKAREVYAAWYDVPEDSLAKRRAASNELTAAHNRLPLGTLVRVTHLKNGKSVVVRITDRGIRDRRVKIDICKEAANRSRWCGKVWRGSGWKSSPMASTTPRRATPTPPRHNRSAPAHKPFPSVAPASASASRSISRCGSSRLRGRAGAGERSRGRVVPAEAGVVRVIRKDLRGRRPPIVTTTFGEIVTVLPVMIFVLLPFRLTLLTNKTVPLLPSA